MKLLKKKVFTLFGRAVPVWLILLFAVTVVAAAFLLTLQGDVVMQARSGPQGTFTLEECRIDAGAGQIDTCTLAGDQFTVEASGLDDSSIIYTAVVYHNDGTVLQHFDTSLPDPLPAGVSDVTLTNGTRDIAGGLGFTTYMFIYLADIQPGQLIDSFQFQYEVSE